MYWKSLVSGVTLLFIFCGTGQSQELITQLEAMGDYNQFAEILQVSGLDEELEDGGPYTVFAPTDTAFEELPDQILQSFLDSPEEMREILEFHIVQESMSIPDLENRSSVPSVQGAEIYIHSQQGQLLINEATVIEPDIEVDNGIIHGIDTVLLPRH